MPMSDYSKDPRIVMTLDAGGTNFRFSAVGAGKAVTETVAMPSNGDNLDRCLANIVEGFSRVKAQCPAAPVAISFAFPAPADYPLGIIGDLYNLPGFRGGVALGPMLEEKFGIPVFINNDGDLFVYGEAIAGFLPHVNGLLEQAKVKSNNYVDLSSPEALDVLAAISAAIPPEIDVTVTAFEYKGDRASIAGTAARLEDPNEITKRLSQVPIFGKVEMESSTKTNNDLYRFRINVNLKKGEGS